MKPVLVLKSCSQEGPGQFARVMEKAGIPFQTIDLEARDTLPSSTSASAILAMSGPDSANDPTPKMQSELQWIRGAVDAGIPYFGVCLGLQMLVKAMGGSVRKNEVKEIGFQDQEGKPYCIDVTPEGRRDPLLQGLPTLLPIFHLHGETVDITPSMKLLATGKWCQNQIVKVTDTAYGMQGHFDIAATDLPVWHEHDADLHRIPLATLHAQWKDVEAEFERIGHAIFRNFLTVAGLL